MNRLFDKYKSEVVSALIQKFNYKNIMQVPKLEKIVINMAVGDAVANSKALEAATADLATIAGQKPVVTRAKKSLAAWKLRKGMPIGCKVTLRGQISGKIKLFFFKKIYYNAQKLKRSGSYGKSFDLSFR